MEYISGTLCNAGREDTRQALDIRSRPPYTPWLQQLQDTRVHSASDESMLELFRGK